MTKIYNNILETIGNTPLVRLNNITTNEYNNTVLAKVESFNPSGSVKDRAAYQMIIDAQKAGRINAETTLIEATSGNLGIALALISSVLKYKLVLFMPDTMSIERRKLLKGYGAILKLTPGASGMKGAIEAANEFAATIPNSLVLHQFKNSSNPNAHSLNTAKEILQATNNNIDIFIAGIGTGGTITGVAKVLKSFNPNIKIIGVEPATSPVISQGIKGKHKIQGIGAGFLPDILETNLVDEYVLVEDDTAISTAKDLALKEGIMAGISSGAAVYAAKLIANTKKYNKKNIVVLLPDTGERYLSTDLFKEYND
ncbi:MAG: cysteine synthase A [Erysipelotrichaceae bacterium]